MPVEQHGFHFRKEVVIAVDVAPARLHHAHRGVGKVMDGAYQEVGRRAKVGVEYGHELARSGFEAFLQRSRLEPMAVGAVMIFDRVAKRSIAFHQRPGEGRRVVGRIVQHLNLQQLLRVFDLDDFLHQALHHVTLVEKRQLDGHRRQLLKMPDRLPGGVLAVLEISVDDLEPVNPVHRENHHHAEVGNEHGPVEPGQLVDARKWRLGEHLAQADGRRRSNQQGQIKTGHITGHGFRRGSPSGP